MRMLRNFLSLIVITIVTQACEPEELTDKQNIKNQNISADTGEYGGGDVEDSRGKK